MGFAKLPPRLELSPRSPLQAPTYSIRRSKAGIQTSGYWDSTLAVTVPLSLYCPMLNATLARFQCLLDPPSPPARPAPDGSRFVSSDPNRCPPVLHQALLLRSERRLRILQALIESLQRPFHLVAAPMGGNRHQTTREAQRAACESGRRPGSRVADRQSRNRQDHEGQRRRISPPAA